MYFSLCISPLNGNVCPLHISKLAQSLPDCAIPMRFVHGTKSPMPVSASTDTLALLPNAELDLASDAGHFVWFEAPGSIRMSLDRLVAQTQPEQFAA